MVGECLLQTLPPTTYHHTSTPMYYGSYVGFVFGVSACNSPCGAPSTHHSISWYLTFVFSFSISTISPARILHPLLCSASFASKSATRHPPPVPLTQLAT